MSVSSDQDERDAAPFLVKLFHRSGSFHRPEEFASSSLPPHISVYTWSNCTLHELALEIAAARPNVLPNPVVGTRLSFQLVCPDLRGASATNMTQPRFAVKDLGSIVIGEGGPGIEESDDGKLSGPQWDEIASSKTLSDWRFVVGDYISCAILPPLSDGSVAPPSIARRGSISGGRGRGSFRGGLVSREESFGRGNGRIGRDGRRDVGFPSGEWRRGETLPDGPSGRPRGRGRW